MHTFVIQETKKTFIQDLLCFLFRKLVSEYKKTDNFIQKIALVLLETGLSFHATSCIFQKISFILYSRLLVHVREAFRGFPLVSVSVRWAHISINILL